MVRLKDQPLKVYNYSYRGGVMSLKSKRTLETRYANSNDKTKKLLGISEPYLPTIKLCWPIQNLQHFIEKLFIF